METLVTGELWGWRLSTWLLFCDSVGTLFGSDSV